MGKMRKEIAAGLTIIGLLLLVFGSMLYKRLRPPSDDGEPEPVLSARELPVPIRNPEATHTLVAADLPAEDTGSGVPAQAWAPPARREAELAAVEQAEVPPREAYAQQGEYPPRESYLPREEQPLDPVDAAAGVDAGAGEPADPFARPRVVAEQRAAEAATNPGESLQQQVDEEFRAESASETMAPVAERGRYGDERADAIVTSGSIPSDAEPPRAGFRSRFPQQEDAVDNGYDSIDRQPAHLQHEAGAMGQHHGHVTVENGKYTVQPNDNYWIVSQKVYGDGGYFKAIYEHNRLRYPRADKLQVGDVLDVPHTSVLLERYADLCPKQRKAPPARNTLMPASTRHRAGERVYVVGEGDTLFDIARYELGKATRWAEIYELNRDVLGEEFDYLRPGTELVLPRGGRDAESVTRSRENGLQR
jgi:nucleoid-associated protein YgaU